MAEPHKPLVPLLAWQQQWIEDDARFKLVVAAAQASGKSFVTSLESAIDRMKPGSVSAQLGILLSASERQSVELMEKVRMHTRAWDVRFEDGYFEQTSIAEHRAIFPNGKRLIALPANPDTARGYSGDLLLDEFALHRDSKAIWAAGMTRVSRGFKCRVASTVKGLGNQFGELLKMLGLADGVAPESQPVRRQGWHGYWVSAEMAVEQGSPVDLEAMRLAIGDEDIWLQDYCNVPIEDGSQYITLALVLACESPDAAIEWDGQPRPGLCAGYDVARKRDGSVIMLGYEVGPILVVCGVRVLSQMTFAQQRAVCTEVAEVVEASGGRFAMDATGIGMQLGEELSGRFDCVEPVNFATAVETGVKDEEGKPLKVMVKERLAGLLKRRCENRAILLPESPQLRREFQAVKRYIGPTGAVRLDAERTAKGGHADWFWATALLCGAMEGPRREYIPASVCEVASRPMMPNLMAAEF
jgi:phage FluMu gp28-like protein